MAGPRLPSVPPGDAGAAGRLWEASDASQRGPACQSPQTRSGCHLWASGGRGHERLRGESRHGAGSVPEPRSRSAGGGRGCDEQPRRAEGRGVPPQRRARWTRTRRCEGSPPSLNFARPRGAPGEVRGGWRGSPPRSAGITWCWGREGGAAPQLSLLLQFLTVSALNSGEAGARRGAGQGGLRRLLPGRRSAAEAAGKRHKCAAPPLHLCF